VLATEVRRSTVALEAALILILRSATVRSRRLAALRGTVRLLSLERLAEGMWSITVEEAKVEDMGEKLAVDALAGGAVVSTCSG
jgi:hypothetical protein